MRHNEIRDTFAKILHDLYYDVEFEPTLQLLQGESFIHKTTSTDEHARLDIKANDLWILMFSRYFFEVKIFNPLAKSCPKNSVEAYTYHESLKRLEYEQRILDVKKSNFVPLVFSCMGGAGPFATCTIRQLASKLAEKKDESYSDAITFIHTKISFALLRSAVICIRGCRGSKRPTNVDSSCSEILREGRLDS